MKNVITILALFYLLCSWIDNATEKTETLPSSKNYSNPDKMIAEGQALLKEGDLIVRLNQDPASRFIKNFNRHDKSYSHAGIIFYENGYPYVFHIVNGEENPTEKLRKDSLKIFCDPRKNIAFGIFRYDMNTGEIARLKALIHKWFTRGVRFDSVFNLKSDDRMYCSEMVSKALTRATRKRIVIETTQLTNNEASLFSIYTHLPFTYTSKLRIIAIDNLYVNPFCHLIKKYDY